MAVTLITCLFAMSSKGCSKICFIKSIPEAIDLDASVIATEWFICLFSKSLPSEINEEEVLNAYHVEEVVSILQKSAHHLFDPDKLLTVAFNKIGPMTVDALTRERKRQKSAVMAEIDQRLRLLNFPKIDDK
ncbi:growth hormone-regulated TBC protein 1-like protein isoform X1 [Cinnamomum micranthum f. kanehirae]|uniref:Growth hormone-regulated TBC protein 1-like protein isoform X1 n=1 Tax=Cinnamomum micranthum f. kanehirae TaxID=337451 RepID=A0A3S3PZ71_9MAGN|nr:growth hormone-regulated TBC protein 1-like protein isoform X1 [Cinnamomum micranthum f. kanehirae]